MNRRRHEYPGPRFSQALRPDQQRDGGEASRDELPREEPLQHRGQNHGRIHRERIRLRPARARARAETRGSASANARRCFRAKG